MTHGKGGDVPRNAVELHQVSKRYLLGQAYHDNLRDALRSGARRLAGRGPRHREELWSLKDVSLHVAEGDTVGLVGRNGAGKSTLLRILTRITAPTAGVARTRGRVGSLLEVGVGFHPELSGRENVYLNGALLGMSRRAIDARFDEIVEFSGVARFLDTPVKRYSSGMYLRLAFAVAAHLDAEIMVVDEVLAVGDAEFQRRCLGKMTDLSRAGRTVVFVSHNLDAIMRLCTKAVWLEQGRVRARGTSAEVVHAYLRSGVDLSAQADFASRDGGGGTRANGRQADGPVTIAAASLHDASGQVSARLPQREPFTVEVVVDVAEHVPGLDVAVFVHNLRGARVLDEAWSDTADDDRGAPGRYVLRLPVPPILAAGDYLLGVWVGSAYEALACEPEALSFRLEGSMNGRNERTVQLSVPWEVTREATTSGRLRV